MAAASRCRLCNSWAGQRTRLPLSVTMTQMCTVLPVVSLVKGRSCSCHGAIEPCQTRLQEHWPHVVNYQVGSCVVAWSRHTSHCVGSALESSSGLVFKELEAFTNRQAADFICSHRYGGGSLGIDGMRKFEQAAGKLAADDISSLSSICPRFTGHLRHLFYLWANFSPQLTS